ncbi:MAG TPA: hypothetical protein HPQ03_16545 [Deltaproteobacteria bacterium]|nr:hypothetical protein [Deltaproteobacteria bacterium]
MKIIPLNKWSRHFKSALIVIALIVTGCSYLPGLQTTPSDESTQYNLDQLRVEIDRWHGTPYRLGGMSRKGIDCSAFAMIIYHDVFDIQIPRTTEQQLKLGKRIDIRSLNTGDLVFFLPESKKMHIGIYLGHGEFAHASVSKGVMVSNINTPYWENIFLTARRLPAL